MADPGSSPSLRKGNASSQPFWLERDEAFPGIFLMLFKSKLRNVFNLPIPKKLDEIVKLSLFESLNAEDIR